jgi:hypothetical protein
MMMIQSRTYSRFSILVRATLYCGLAFLACGVALAEPVTNSLIPGEAAGQAVTNRVGWQGDRGEFVAIETAAGMALANHGKSAASLRLVPDRGLLSNPFDADASTLSYSFDIGLANRSHGKGGPSLRLFIGSGVPHQAAVRLEITGVRKIIINGPGGESQFAKADDGSDFLLPQPEDGEPTWVEIELDLDYGKKTYQLTIDGVEQHPEAGLPFQDASAATPAIVFQNVGIDQGDDANGRYLPLLITDLSVQ